MALALIISAVNAQEVRVTTKNRNGQSQIDNQQFARKATAQMQTSDYTPSKVTPQRAPAGMVNVTLTAGDVWGDGTGYQLLLDANANMYDNATFLAGLASCSAPATLYNEFEYKIPTNANPVCTTSNIIVNNSATIQIPAGTYDYYIINPLPGARFYIAGGANGSRDNYVFEEGKDYTFTAVVAGQNDAITITVSGGEPTTCTAFFCENFDGAITGWTKTTTATPNWQQANLTDNPFSVVDPSNVSSIIHPYSDPLNLNNIIYTTVDMTSLTSDITLKFWAGYSGPWMPGGVETTTQYPGADVKAVISTNGGTSWTPVWAYTDSHAGDEDWLWENYTVSLNAYAGQTILLGFQYIGKGGDLAAIDNVEIDGEGGSSVPIVNGNEINIYQNNGDINVLVSENSDIRLLDIYGRVLGNYNVVANSTLKVHQPAGIYLLEVKSNGGVSTHKVVVK